MKRAHSLDWAHPLVREWFINQVGEPTEPQRQGWPSILAGKATLISAPTGSGKTFAAFLACLDQLIRKALAGTLSDETEVLYVSPLKALGNDIQKNVMTPLNGILALAETYQQPMAQINVSVRSGDTPAKERAAMAKKPPHILVTTPESLYILLTTEKSREILRSVKTVIIDEIHALADDKRGSHLSLSLERLEALTHQPPLRIGLSATQKPLQRVADFLMGNREDKAVIINIGHAKHLELTVEVPSSELGAVASNEMWDEIYDRLAELARQNRSTLIFANTRRVAERVAHHLAERLGADQVAAHHGSLARKLRLKAENQLKNGELKALVATASLELGIDIGSVDLVCQLGSPRAIAVMLQRVGRAGHWHGAVSKGRLFVTTRDELLECAALVYAIRDGDLDELIIPEAPLDILAQQLVASCATDEWQEDDLFALVRRAYPYRALSRQTFDVVLEMLAEGIAGSRGRYSAYLFRDRVNGRVKGRRGSRLTAITNGGAIPENGLFTVITEPTGAMVGTLDEDFAVESNRGDIILLGSTSWQIRRIESATGRVLVEDAHGAPPTVPFWRGEAPGRTNELSLQVSALRQRLSDLLPAECLPAAPASEQLTLTQDALKWLIDHCQVNRAGAEQLVEYILQGRALLGAVPTQQTVIAERFFDEAGGMQLIIHAPFGARINKAWGLALRKCFCRSFNFELQASATDDGINIALAEQHSFPLADVFAFLNPKSITRVLTQAVLQSPLFATRWRWDAGRALALIRFRNGKKVPPNIQRMLADDLLAAVFPDAAACQDNLGGRDIELPDHPLINETIKDALTEALDLQGLITVLDRLKRGEINYLAVDTPTPSAFAHEILNANPYAFLDDAPLEERRARAVTLRRILPESLLDEIGQLDPDIIAEVKQQVWPDVRDKDELQDALQTLIALPVRFLQTLTLHEQWPIFFNELRQEKRAGSATLGSETLWFAAEKAKTFAHLYPEAVIQDALPAIEDKPLLREEALIELIRGWMFSSGPISAEELARILSLTPSETEQALLRLEASGVILRGSFTGRKQEWCERRLLARIHRLTLGKLRREIEPVTAIKFMQWLLTWQHVTPGTQLRDEQGLIEVISQLQGVEIPAKAWEKDIFAKRVAHYDPGMLDRLCLMGIIGWGRLSKTSDMASENKRVIPTSVAPITFFVRDNADWMPAIKPVEQEDELSHLSHVARLVYAFLKHQGASFFNEIAEGVHALKSEIEMALWELVTAGLTTADGFDNLRSLIDPKRRLNKKRRRPLRHQYSTGRWSLLKTPQTNPDNQTEALCWLLLKRYGVVFRDLIAREKLIPTWRELLLVFRRLEARGEIRGGRFVSGFLGEQFALPYAVDSLRAIKNKAPHREAIHIAAVDPLNVVGFILPGQRIAALSGKTVIFQGERYYEDSLPAVYNDAFPDES
ncbi:DEAD/DEAH box helicase [Legionella taurinensis]|uniref:DEAD/DEAH box helicase n=1 Tax=Legionella taurinensis TaxID=70611 RepID=A0A3A5LAE6_9GAMM|nr:DEAD/DEAH box helicase [Legionella taurinensis]MDX1837209.1 DEAD/DEAH box helicase [Legionella taurinensis]PUT40317.1 DEAD/DEAH box helicase [Legionella taurinensis]PUT41551.1 DEAD/DEAH box helicase [Legionella taurinensis]PUT44417.1 DEAD/DEAH box helicase [Legionella taurinensis]PUT48379.1 DEAD/DEAH box helicase [Legionella taurinensis]